MSTTSSVRVQNMQELTCSRTRQEIVVEVDVGSGRGVLSRCFERLYERIYPVGTPRKQYRTVGPWGLDLSCLIQTSVRGPKHRVM